MQQRRLALGHIKDVKLYCLVMVQKLLHREV